MNYLKNKRLAIVLAGAVEQKLFSQIKECDVVIAVDGGYNCLSKVGINADVIIGDMDSIQVDSSVKKIVYPTQKDDTDFKLALDYAKRNNYDYDILVFGFASIDRIDHVISNLAVIDENVRFVSLNQEISLHTNTFEIENDNYVYYSFYALEPIRDFSLRGFEYELDNYRLLPFDPLCISNKLASKCAVVEFEKGRLLMIKSIES